MTHTAEVTSRASAQADPPQTWPLMISQDLAALTWLHQQERSSEVLRACADSGFPQSLLLLGPDHPAVTGMYSAIAQLPAKLDAARAMATALTPSGPMGHAATGAPDETPAERCDKDLAADYASIYLTHNLRAAPLESVWLDEDHLMLQGSTFEVRDFYRRHGVRVSEWRIMPDDHLCHELNFLSILISRSQLQEAAEFMQQHLMRWLPLFCNRVAERSATRFYAAVARLTLAYCQALQQRLPRPKTIRIEARPLEREVQRDAGC